MYESDWKNEFLQLYTSDTKGDFGKALDLKRKNMPQKLYRYRPVNNDSLFYRFGEIIQGELYMCHPAELNDPFEGCSILHSSAPSEYFRDSSIFQASLKNHVDDETLEYIFDGSDWFEKLIHYVVKSSSSPDRIAANEGALRKTFMVGMEQCNAHFTEVIQKTTRIACFSESSDNLPMWNHYAGGYTGICLEYDVLTNPNIYQVNRLEPVFYVDQLPDMTKIAIRKENSFFTWLDYPVIHKLNDWRYEKEWRLIYNVGSWYFGLEDVPKEYWDKGRTIQFMKPSKIILGMKISPEHEQKIRQYAEIAAIPVVKAQCTQYGLRID